MIKEKKELKRFDYLAFLEKNNLSSISDSNFEGISFDIGKTLCLVSIKFAKFVSPIILETLTLKLTEEIKDILGIEFKIHIQPTFTNIENFNEIWNDILVKCEIIEDCSNFFKGFSEFLFSNLSSKTSITLDLSEADFSSFNKNLSFFDNERNKLIIYLQHSYNIKFEIIMPIIKYDEGSNKTNKTEESNFTSNVFQINQLPNTEIELKSFSQRVNSPKIKVSGYLLLDEDPRKVNFRELKNDTVLFSAIIYENYQAYKVKRFIKKNTPQLAPLYQLKTGNYVDIVGRLQFDTYENICVVFIDNITVIDGHLPPIVDSATNKRIELGCRTKMSVQDSIVSVEEYYEYCMSNGYSAVGFTDYGGVQSFPAIEKAFSKSSIKPIYGCCINLVDDLNYRIVSNPLKEDADFNQLTYTIFDIETTGLSLYNDEIIEIGAVKVIGGTITAGQFSRFIKPTIPVPQEIYELTHIDAQDLETALPLELVLKEFMDFAEGTILVAHNSIFDVTRIEYACKKVGYKYTIESSLDTLELARCVLFEVKSSSFSLESLANYYGVKNQGAHRAIYDAIATKEIFTKLIETVETKFDIHSYNKISDLISTEKVLRNSWNYQAKVLVLNKKGLKNLYALISNANTIYSAKGPKYPLSDYLAHKEGLLLGTGSFQSKLFELIQNSSIESVQKELSYFDYVEIEPPNISIYKLHTSKQIAESPEKRINQIIHEIYNQSSKANKMVIVSTNPRYLHKEEEFIYKFLTKADLKGKINHQFKDDSVCFPQLYFQTTKEIEDSLSFLGEYTVQEIVHTNPQKIVDMVEKFSIFPVDKNNRSVLYSIGDDVFKDLGIPSALNEMKRLIDENLDKRYGLKNLSPSIRKRVDSEMTKITKYGFASIYFAAYLLVKKTTDDGFYVGSRGSVGSSFIANIMHITEVNPLPPHYYCPNGCGQVFKMSYEERMSYGIEQDEELVFNLDNVTSGYDLAPAKCPVCGATYLSDGFGIPFETFLGFDGDKTPDIDLNFSDLYQDKAHEYIREMFGKDYCFRGGTVLTAAKKTAWGYVKHFYEDNNLPVPSDSNVNLYAKYLTDVKKTSGSHAGGIVVVPKDKDILDVTPIQYPSDDLSKAFRTTHYDYHSFESNLLKFDALGHGDPTLIKLIMDYVKENKEQFGFDSIDKIPLSDKGVIDLFNDLGTINLTAEDVMQNFISGSTALPEFNTDLNKSIILGVKPKNFGDLVKISGLAHGTNVWGNNAEILVNGTGPFGKIPIDQIIGCRDDILEQLLRYGVENKTAFDIMEFVRKGKPQNDWDKWNKYAAIMKENKVPDWYIWSCSKIAYMFPKAHAIAYCIMATRLAWFKLYHPLVFYYAYFSSRKTELDYEVVVNGTVAVQNKIKELRIAESKTPKESSSLGTYLVILEAMKRGFKFHPIDLKKSHATRFKIWNNGLLLPFQCIDGIGTNMAYNLQEYVEEHMDTLSVTSLNEAKILDKTAFSKFETLGVFDKINEV